MDSKRNSIGSSNSNDDDADTGSQPRTGSVPTPTSNTPGSRKRYSGESAGKSSKRGTNSVDIDDETWKDDIRKAVEESHKIARLQKETATQTAPKFAKLKIAPPRITKSYYDRLKDKEFYRLRRPLPTKAKSYAGFPRVGAYGEILKGQEEVDDEDYGDEYGTPSRTMQNKGMYPIPGPASVAAFHGTGTSGAALQKGQKEKERRRRKKKDHVEDNAVEAPKSAMSTLSVDDGGNVLSYFDPKYVKPDFLPLLTKSRNIVVGPPTEILRKYFGYNYDDELPEEFRHDDSHKAFILPKKFWKDYDDVVEKEAAPVRTLPLLHDTSSKAFAAAKKKKEEDEKKRRDFEPDSQTVKEMQEDDARPDGFIPRQPKHYAVEYLARQPFKKYGMMGSNLNDASPGMMEHMEMKPMEVDAGGQIHRDPAERGFTISKVTSTPVKVGKKEGKLTDDQRPWYQDGWAEGYDPELLDKQPEFQGPHGHGKGDLGGPPRRGPDPWDRDRPSRDDRERGRTRPSDRYSDGSGGSGYSCTCGDSYSDSSSSESSSSSSSSGKDGDGDEEEKPKRKGKKHRRKKSKDSDEASDGSDKGKGKKSKRRKSKDKDKEKDEKGLKVKRTESKDDAGSLKSKGSLEKMKDMGTDAFPEPMPDWAPDAWKSPEGFRGWFFKHNKGKKGSISTPDLPQGSSTKDKDWFKAYLMMKKANKDKNVDEIKSVLGDTDSAKEFFKALESEWKIAEELEVVQMDRLPRDIPTPREYPEQVQPSNFEYYKSYPLYPTISNERYFEWFKDVDRLENPKRKRQRVRPAGLSKSVGNINWDDPKEAAKWYSYGYRRPDSRPKPERPDYDTRDFIYDNARSIIMMPPKRGIPKYIDDRKGTEHFIEPSGLVKRFVYREDYGEVPEYLMGRNVELGRPPMPDMDKFYRPHRCKYLHGHIHCKICMRAHPTVKHRKIKWDCEMDPCDFEDALSYRESRKYLEKTEPGYFVNQAPDYSDHFDINKLIHRLVQANQGYDRGRQQNFFEYFKDDSRSNNCFSYNSPPVYV